MKQIGQFLLVAGLGVALTETLHFGGNLFPETKEEFVWDIISLSVAAIGFVIVLESNYRENVRSNSRDDQ